MADLTVAQAQAAYLAAAQNENNIRAQGAAVKAAADAAFANAQATYGLDQTKWPADARNNVNGLYTTSYTFGPQIHEAGLATEAARAAVETAQKQAEQAANIPVADPLPAQTVTSETLAPDIVPSEAVSLDLPPVQFAPDNGQTITDYATPTATDLQSELGAKLQEQGNAYTFSSMSSSIDLMPANGDVLALLTGSGTVLGSVGSVPSDSTPANAVASGDSDKTGAMKVVISAEPRLGDPGDSVTFDAMPTIDESRSATYRGFTPIQHPGEILKYEGTQSRSFTVTVKLISRTVAEADANLKKINLIRSWVMPFYGQGTADNPTTSSYLGAPPPVLTLKAYGPKMIGPVKCVMESYQWNWPNDVDWIHTSGQQGDVVPFPVILQITISMKETWSPSEFSKFDLMKYRVGDLPAAFGGSAANASVSANGANAPGVSPSSVDLSQISSISGAAGGIVNAGRSQIAAAEAGINSQVASLQSQANNAIAGVTGSLGGAGKAVSSAISSFTSGGGSFGGGGSSGGW